MSGKVKPFGSDYLRYIPNKYLKLNDSAPAWDQEYIESPIQCYLFTTGFWQYWDMFAPNPSNIDFWGDAIVHYKDGSQKVYQYPRIYLMPIYEKFFKERYRKFYERANDSIYPYLFKPFAMRVALLNYTNHSNPPVRVDLRRHWLKVADPGEPQEKAYSAYIYYIGFIHKADLDAMAAVKG
jgi:hypothetical protein